MYENPETKILLYGNPNMLTIHVPIALGQDEIGSIFCGEKRSGEVYTSEDVKLLETFAYQAATALSRAKFYLEIKNHAENLESNVAARTKDLRKAQEHQKQMMLEISHNLQTPLAIFQTKIEQLKQKKRLNPEVAGFEQSLKDLSSFIYSLLTLAKIENRPEPPTITTFNVSELVRDIAEEMSIIAENSNIKLATDITRDIFIMGNPKELREAILNMLSNAVKYMHPTGIREIRIDLKKIGGVARLSIADTGVGINQTDVDQLFERFYRVKNSGNSIGTGLGLAITKRIVDYHHGKIWCESKKGSGTTFYVDVPLAESERTYWGG